MKIRYKILSVDQKEMSYVVRYYTDFLSEDDLATSFDIDGDIIRDSNGFPIRCRTDFNYSIMTVNDVTAENVNRRIITGAPALWFEMQEKIKSNSAPALSNVTILMNTVHEFEPNTATTLL